MSVIAFCKNEPPPFPYTFVCLLCRMMIMQVEKENRGKEKLFALVVPKFHKVCAEAKAPSGPKTH